MADINKLKNKARREEQRENWTRAIELYKKALLESERDRDGAADLSLFNRIGDIHLRLGDKRQAVQFYEQAIRRYADQDLHTSAIALCNKVLRILPDRLEIFRQLGQLQAASGLAADARSNYLHYASEMMKTRRTDRALEALEECAEATGDQEAALRLAGLFVELGREEEAISRLQGLRERLRERGAKVDRLEARLAALGSGTAAPGPGAAAQPSAAAAGSAGLTSPAAGEPAAAKSAAEEPAVERAGEGSQAIAELEAELGGEAAPAGPSAAPAEAGAAPPTAEPPIENDAPGPHFGPEEAEAAPASFRVQGVGRLPAPRRRLDASESSPPYPAERVAASPPREVAEVSATSVAGTVPAGGLEPEVAERAISASLPPAGAASAPEAPERTAGALRAALEAATQRLGRTANGATRTSETPPEGSGGRARSPHAGRISFQYPLDGGLPVPELPAAEPDGSEPALDGPEQLGGLGGSQVGFDPERPESIPYGEATPPGEPAVGIATRPILEKLETGIDHPGPSLLEQGFAARAADNLEEAVAAFEAALACPDVFVQAYGELRECREALAERAATTTEAAPAPAAEVEPAPAQDEVDAVVTELEADLSVPAAELQTEAPQADLQTEEPEAALDAGAAQASASAPRTGGVPGSAPSPPAADAATRSPGPGRTGAGPGAGAPSGPDRTAPEVEVEDPTAEFRQWIQTAPPGLLERSLRELQARGETKKAALVSGRLRELVAAEHGSETGKDDDSGREPSGPPSREGVAMPYASDAIERAGPGPAVGGTELLEATRPQVGEGDAPQPYDRLAGDATAVNFDELLAELKTSLAEDQIGPDTRSRTELGAELKSMGLLDEAIRELQAAVREPTAPPEAYELLGEAFIEKGQPRIAARLLASAVTERGFGDRESLGVLYQLGLSYEQLADREHALDCYERIFSVDIDYRDIKERIIACAG